MFARVMPRCLLMLPALLSLFILSCQKETQVARANREGIMLVGNSAEPKALDHQLVTGVPESKVITAIFEGLVADDATQDDAYPPGAAASWEHNEDMTGWIFHLQPEGKWSDGAPVTAHDFVFAYNRLLHPDFAGPYAEMLYFLENAEAYNKGQITDFYTGRRQGVGRLHAPGQVARAGALPAGAHPALHVVSSAAARRPAVRKNDRPFHEMERPPEHGRQWRLQAHRVAVP